MERNNLILRWGLPLVASTALVCSCQDYEPFTEQHIQDVAYTHEFERKFGKIDPNQNWDLFGQLGMGYRTAAITRATSPDEVSVTDEDYTLIITPADMTEYEKVLPESDTSARPLSQTNLNRVTQDFVTTARQFTIEQVNFNTIGVDVIGIYWYCDQDDPGATRVVGRDGIEYWIQRKEIYANKTNIKAYRPIYEWVHLIPGDAYYAELFREYPDRYIRYNGEQNVHLVGEETLSIGDQIFDTETVEDDGTKIWRKCSEWGWNGTKHIPDIIRRDLMILHSDYVTPDGSDAYKRDNNGNLETLEAGTFVYLVEEKEITYYNSNLNPSDKPQSANNYFPDAAYLRSQPIHVEIPSSIPYYGFYITNSFGASWGGGGTRYSEANLNDQVTFSDAGQQHSHYVATFDIHDIDPNMESQQYICFEDWMDEATNFDLNDLVFNISLDPTTIIDHESTNEWAILVCEDLTSYDFDFNDVVLQLHYLEGIDRVYRLDVNGNVIRVDRYEDVPKLTITAMAAGGAYESNVYVKDMDNPWGEIHVLLGESGSYDKHNHTIINAGEEYGSPGVQMELKGFTNQQYSGVAGQLPPKNVGTENGQYPTYLSQLYLDPNLKFFKIICDDVYNDITNAKIIESGTYEEGVAPQMMLLPAYFEWPQEEVYIKDAYEDFQEWVNDYSKTQWIMASQKQNLITDRGNLWTTGSTGIEVGTLPLVFYHEQTFRYTDKHGIVTEYPHSAFIDVNSSFPQDFTPQSENYGLLTIVYSSKPGPTTYIDFGDGSQLLEDKSNSTVISYHLSKSQYQKAYAEGIYIMSSNPDNPVVISTAELVTYRTSDSN